MAVFVCLCAWMTLLAHLVDGFDGLGAQMRSPTRLLATSKSQASFAPDPCYNLAVGTAATSAGLVASGNLAGGAVMGSLGALFAVQAGRVRFVFDDEALELKVSKEDEPDFASSGENVVVGGANRWNYDTFTEWFFIPSKEFPVLMYFKETQTKPEVKKYYFTC